MPGASRWCGGADGLHGPLLISPASGSTSRAGLLRAWELRVEMKVLNRRWDGDPAGGDVLVLMDLDVVCEGQEEEEAA